MRLLTALILPLALALPNVPAQAADAGQARSDDGKASALEGTFGLGLLVGMTPAVAVDLAWDLTTSAGKNSGTVLAQGFTAGLRLRF